MAPRPLVSTTIRTEFGDVLDSPEFHDVATQAGDLTYVPGFSDLRRARDVEIAAVASGRKPAHEARLKPLPVNVRWTRTHTPKGSPDGIKQLSTGNLGYTAVNKDRIGKESWLTALPPGATVEADGTIRKGDCILMVTDGKTAGRNAARKQIATARMTSDVEGAATGLLDVAKRKNGIDAYIKQEGA